MGERQPLHEDPGHILERMQLRYAGRCRGCGAALPPGAAALYDRSARTVTCLVCAETPTSLPDPATGQGWPVAAKEEATPRGPAAVIAPVAVTGTDPEVVTGTAGASARREHERRRAARGDRIRRRHPRLGGLILALTDDPQTTTAWQTGAHGEETLGRRLDRLTKTGVLLLHDRRIPGTTANIDHLAVTATGVYVIDAKRHRGRPSLHVQGGLLRPRTEKLLVGSRDCTKLVAGVHRQQQRVRAALDRAGAEAVPVHGMLCFVDADWPLVGGGFTIAGVHVLWPKKAATTLTRPGPLGHAQARAVHRTLAAAFPPA